MYTVATPTGASVDDGMATSRSIHRRTGPTFYLATRLFPERMRRDTYVLYAFFRLADEVVDDPERSDTGRQYRELARIEAGALGREPTDDPVVAAFCALRERHGIPDEEVETFIDAMRMDLETDRYVSHEALASYLRGSAVAVGNMMLAVMDPADASAARPHAKALAEAFQLTNFLRDVREDARDYGRVYIPQETLSRFDVSDEQIRSLEFSRGVADAVRSELESTEWLYVEGVAGIRYLPREYQFAVVAASVMYADHHRLIRDADFDVVSRRPTLSRSRRAWVLARTWWHWRRTGDPVRTFLASSSIATEPSSPIDTESSSSIDTGPSSSIDSEPKMTEGHRQHSGCIVTRLFRA